MSYSNDHPCIIGTNILDVAKVFAVTSGYDPLDPSSLMLPPAEPVIDLANMKPPKIGIVRNFFPEMTGDVVNASIEASAKELARAGAMVDDVYLPKEFDLVWDILALTSVEGWTYKARQRGENIKAGKEVAIKSMPVTVSSSRAEPAGASMISDFVPAQYYLHAQRVRRWLRDMVDEQLSGYDAVMMATAPEPAPADLSTSGDPTLCRPWSILGNPAISIPATEVAPNGMPIGLQLVAPNLADESLLAAGAWCQEVLGVLPVPAMEFA
jgi:amidase